MDPLVLEFIGVQADDFIRQNGSSKEAVEYLAFLSINGVVRHNDLKCDAEHLKELNNSARDSGLVSEKFEASDSTKKNLHDFLKEGTNKLWMNSSKIYDEVKNRDVHEKAMRFIGLARTDDHYQYLAALAIKGEVKSSDLNNDLEDYKLSAFGKANFAFKELNGKAAEIQLVSPERYISKNKGVASEETQKALQKFILEKNKDTEHLRRYLLANYEIVKNRVLKNDPDFEMATENWKPIDSKNITVVGIKHYLAREVENTFPGNKPVVKYGIGKEGDSWADEIVFRVDLLGRGKVDDCVQKFQKIFPDLEGDASVYVLKNKEGNGFSVFGRPDRVADSIKINDPLGWNRREQGKSRSWWRG